MTELLSNSLELFTLLRSEGSNFTWEKKLKVALSIITALRFLHTKKMIYRNLNTKNIWVCEMLPFILLFFFVCCFNVLLQVDSNWRVKLSELGFVKTDTATNGKTPRRGYEDLGMAPEILRGEEYSGKADVFSFGVVLYEIITVAEVPARNMSTNFGFEMEDISKELQKVSGCPGPLRSLTLQCLEGVPDDRPEARTVVMILKDFVASHSEGGPQKTTPSDQNAAFPSTTIRSENLTEVEPNPAKNHSPSTAIGTTSSLGSTEISGAGGRNVQNSVSPHLEGKPAGEKEIAKAPLERKVNTFFFFVCVSSNEGTSRRKERQSVEMRRGMKRGIRSKTSMRYRMMKKSVQTRSKKKRTFKKLLLLLKETGKHGGESKQRRQ